MPTHDADAEFELRLLRAQSSRDRAILGAVSTAYAVMLDQRVLEVNDALCRLLGFSAQELVGAQAPWPFWPPEGRAIALRLLEEVPARVESTGLPYTFEMPLMRKDGGRFIAEITVAAAREPSGRLIGYVSTVLDVTSHRDYEAELQRLADQDPLTGLANRRVFEQRLEQEIADAVRHDRQLAVAILDLDHFKSINDRFGHPVGDRVLKEAADRLRVVQRQGDVLARIGGEEFAWILTDVHSHGAWAAVERARHAISESPFDDIGELTISIGVSLRGDLRVASQLYENADQALYRAKREGRNRSILSRSI
jgi:diguanylate cyclase (GGDEF)-like protein/PAS domain S-box-containing protein